MLGMVTRFGSVARTQYLGEDKRVFLADGVGLKLNVFPKVFQSLRVVAQPCIDQAGVVDCSGVL